MKLLKDLFLDELADMYDAERRIVKALPKLAAGATCEKLKAAFTAHLHQTEGHITKLEKVFELFGEKAVGKTCEATVGLLKEGDALAADFKGSPAINAALISAAQRVEHYEMAAYGCLHEWAGLLGHAEAAGILQSILREETWLAAAATRKRCMNPTKLGPRQTKPKKRNPCAKTAPRRWCDHSPARQPSLDGCRTASPPSSRRHIPPHNKKRWPAGSPHCSVSSLG